MGIGRKKDLEGLDLVDSPFVISSEEVFEDVDKKEIEKKQKEFESELNQKRSDIDIEFDFLTEDTETQNAEVSPEVSEEEANVVYAPEMVGNNDVEIISETEEKVEENSVLPVSEEKTETKRLGQIFTKKRIIILSSVAGLLVVLTAGFFTLSHFWKNGDLVMPSFIASTGLYQGDDFVYYDCITVNGINIGGLTKSQAVNKIKTAINKKPVNYNITVAYEDQSITFTEDDISYEIKSDDVLKKAKEYCIKVLNGKAKKKKKSYEVEFCLSDKCKENILAKSRKAIHRDAVNASFGDLSSGNFNYTEEQTGYELDDADCIKMIEEAIAAGKKKFKIEAKVKVIEPTVKRTDLSQNIVELSSYSTRSTNNANGNKNMRLAMQCCNGSVIEPGATWSFNGCTGNSENTAAGWVPASAYSGGYVVQSVGGGICQASTTIYIAALYANMQVVERSAHAWQSSYARAGLDATVNYGNLDLKLKNPTKYPMYLSCSMSGTTLTCKVYGSKEASFDEISLSTEQIDYVAGEYFRVRTYRTVTLNGNSVTSAIDTSKYSLKPQQTREQAEASRNNTPSTPTPPTSPETPSTPTPPETSSTPTPEPPAPSSEAPSSGEESSSPQSAQD